MELGSGNMKAVAEKAAKSNENAEIREEGRFVEDEEEDMPREEVDAPEVKRGLYMLDGDGEEKEEAVGRPSENLKRADILVRNVCSNRTDCMVDSMVIDPNQPSYRSSTPEAVLRKHKHHKKRKYIPDCQTQRRDFTPFLVTT